MSTNTPFFKLLTTVSALAGILTLTACESSSDSVSSLRVIHASPDAPPVNIEVDSTTWASDLDYAETSGYMDVSSGARDLAVEAIIPSGNADVITVPGFQFDEHQRYTVIAANNTANIEPLVAIESAATPGADEVAISVVHASPAAASVDVYVTAPGSDINSVNPNFTFDFKAQVDAGALPSGTYQIRVTSEGSKAVVYDSGDVDLSPFAGEKLMLIAASTTTSTNKTASPIKLIAAADMSSLELLDTNTAAGARVVHASPDAGSAAGGPVEVFASSTALPTSPTELIEGFSYTDIVPSANTYVGVPAGNYVFDVAPDNAGIGGSVYTSPTVTLEQGAEYSVIAAGNVLTTPAFGLLATEDNNRSIITQASVKVIHAAPLAGDVDIFVTSAGEFTVSDVENGLAGAPLLDDFAYSDITDYVAVAPGNYDIRVVAGGTAAINVENFDLAAGSVSSIIARQPIDSGTPSDFGVILLTN